MNVGLASQRWIPPEVWSMIFKMISKKQDIKNVRLVCKMFEELANPFLLSRVICTSSSSSLDTLMGVSRHPVFSRSVVEVVYVCTGYRFFKTLQEYKEARRPWPSPKFEEPKSQRDWMDLKRAFTQYHRAYDDQTAMEDSGEALACLCSALMRMPHIETITVTPNFDCYPEDYCDYGYDLEPHPRYNEAFLLVARALSLTDTKIRNLEIQNEEDTDPGVVNGALFRGMSNLNLNHCCNAFRGLCNIKIAANEDNFDGWMTGNLAKILSGATDLESLCFEGRDGEFHISTEHILGTTTWSRLVYLNFAYTNLDQGELLQLLKRHSGTLKCLVLFCVNLRNGSWKPFLEEVKSSLSLQDLSIDYPSQGDGEEVYFGQGALNDYLFGDGPSPL